jgi:D-arabinose 1-dehydrogenase-like Zn-dependent alcohol dehydrogenase
LNGIIDTVSVSHPVLPLIGLLKSNGKLVMVGAVAKPLELPVFSLLGGNHMKNACIYTHSQNANANYAEL